MKFFFVAGELEKHVVEYESDALTSSFTIKVDDRVVQKERRFIPRLGQEFYTIGVGGQERCDVTIAVARDMFLQERARVYINGRLSRCLSTTEQVSQELGFAPQT